MKYTIKTAHWRVPSKDRAFENWLEGGPTPEERVAILSKIAHERENWAPSSEAWGQLRELEYFIGQRVCIQFWDPIMFLIVEDGPYLILADCQGIALLRREEFLQAYLILDRIEEYPTVEGYSPAKILESENKLNCTLAPIAEMYEIDDELGRDPEILEAILAERDAVTRERKATSCAVMLGQGFSDEDADRFLGLNVPRRPQPLNPHRA